ncbi:MAG: nucleotidyltransferase family protein [Haliangiales bacterium]
MSSAIPAVVLAAGRGRRLGDVAKATLETRSGETFLAAIQACAHLAGVDRAVVVIGPPHDARSGAEAARLCWPTVRNPHPERGMASSVELGFAHVCATWPDAPAALLWPVDHARVTAPSVRRVIAACRPDGAVIPTYRGRGGHPAGFGRELWPALTRCQALPHGARSVLHSLRHKTPERVTRIELDDVGLIADIDTPGDARRAHPVDSR